MANLMALYAGMSRAFRQQQWQQVQAFAAELQPHSKDHAGVHGMAGVACLELRQFSQAVEHLHRATEIDASRADFATLYSKALLSNYLSGQARVAADRAMLLKPKDPETWATLGVIYVQIQGHAQAAVAFEQALALVPTSTAYRLNLATALAATGDVGDAETQLEAALALDSSCWPAHLLLAQLRKQTINDNHLARLHALSAKHQNDSAAMISLNMAMAKEYEDLGQYTEAFRHTVQGKRVRRSLRTYSIRNDEELFAALKRAFPLTSPASTSGEPSEEAIFIIGLPRCGTTLVERILSSHPDVHAGGELQNFSGVLQQYSGGQQSFLLDPHMPLRTQSIDWRRLGARYLASVRPVPIDKLRFTDKLPHNFLYAGHIAKALPNARIICMRRDPMDTCLSNFRQLFAHPSIHFDYANDLLDTGRYFILFDRLMKHWKTAFPGRIHEVSYETLVNSQETTTRQLVEYCGLQWNDACLHFETNPAPVGTMSSQQVRRPIFRSAMGHWKHYGKELLDLRELLHGAGLV